MGDDDDDGGIDLGDSGGDDGGTPVDLGTIDDPTNGGIPVDLGTIDDQPVDLTTLDAGPETPVDLNTLNGDGGTAAPVDATASSGSSGLSSYVSGLLTPSALANDLRLLTSHPATPVSATGTAGTVTIAPGSVASLLPTGLQQQVAQLAASTGLSPTTIVAGMVGGTTLILYWLLKKK